MEEEKVSETEFSILQEEQKKSKTKSKSKKSNKSFERENSQSNIQAFTTGKRGVKGFTRVNFAHYDNKTQ